jgi:hypothetical protein
MFGIKCCRLRGRPDEAPWRLAVIAHAGIQYAAALRLHHWRPGILGRPVIGERKRRRPTDGLCRAMTLQTRFRRAFRSRSGMTPSAESPPSAPRQQGRQVLSWLTDRDADHRALIFSRKNSCKNFAQEFRARTTNGRNFEQLAEIIRKLRRYRHRHADLDRKHREGDDQAQRQRTDRERSRDGVGQSGRGNGRRTAFKASGAGRPYHGRVPSLRERITRDTDDSQESRAILRRSIPENGKMTARAAVIAAIPALHASFSVQAWATRPAGSSTAASGRQSMVTKPRVCSIRRNQARIAGNVARS